MPTEGARPDLVPVPRARAAVGLNTARRSVRSGVLWGYVFGLTVASAALGYVATYKTAGQRTRFADLFSSNTGLAAINGPAYRIQTVAGYTVWKSLMFLMVAGSVWGLLTSTKLLRGEEDAGHWELLLAGRTTRRGAAGQALAGLGVSLAALGAVTALIVVAVGRSSKIHIATGPALFFAVSLTAAPAMFLAGGACASQLAATRRQAAAYAGAALGLFYALRLVSDSASGLSWLRWITPLGWVEELRPLTGERPLALLPIAALTIALVVLTVYLAGRRDLGASVLPARVSARPRLVLLSGPIGLALRLMRPLVVGWAAAIAAMALLMGSIAKQGGAALSSSATIQRAVSRLGVRGGGAAEYLGFSFLLLAVLLAFVAVGQVTAARGEEAEGRLEHFLVRPVSRTRWLIGRATVAAAVLVTGGLVAGFFTWFGAASQSAHVGLISLLETGVSIVAPALCICGVGILALGLVPRATPGVAYGVLGWSLLIELLGGFFSTNHWLLDTSVFHHLTAAPAVNPDWVSVVALAGIGVIAAAVGGVALDNRDLVGE